ncbi:dienelactone hydrolase family protein [Nocardia stercoris]|uniref:Dienelactone hydrolase family protein n=1 Tax=Nocardia stercoris TaxID=2483361 RepID=A0A3M2L4A8_9NOCA|nr:dienelactone hydrolase family protein [Nocardia stercoris]RMI32552.1 dienelactone hydrolase family protein [Nocardia stercoris]
MTAVQGASVDVQTSDGVADAYFVHPADGAAHPAVLVYTDAFGLRPVVRAFADDLAAQGYTVLVPNLFYRAGSAPVLELPGYIDTSVRHDVFDSIRPLIAALTPATAISDAGAYLDFLAAAPQAAPGPVGIAGYCMGARLGLRTAAAYPDRVAAVGCFHGGNLANDAPDSPHLEVGAITAELYFGHADQDPSLPPAQIERLEQALQTAGVRYAAEVYPGAHHGYTQPDTAAYNAEAADRHRTALLALFERTLK